MLNLSLDFNCAVAFLPHDFNISLNLFLWAMSDLIRNKTKPEYIINLQRLISNPTCILCFLKRLNKTVNIT